MEIEDLRHSIGIIYIYIYIYIYISSFADEMSKMNLKYFIPRN